MPCWICSLLVAVALVGCGPQVKPDPVAPIVLQDVCEPVEIPIPVHRPPPADLAQPLDLDAPDVLPAGQGDYGLTRVGLELIIDGFRHAQERLQRWRAWAK